ncbi:MAG: ParA family protein [Lachnospiraceae bacterium]|nr:ParA family protein [Lachnospiraceae bacterium]
MSNPTYVAFASQKGGCGKSTLTTLVASYLHYVEGVEVLVMDCDSRQHTQKSYRDNDVLVTRENPLINKTFMNFYKKFNGNPYDIIYTSPGEAIEQVQEEIEKGNKAKIVFFDITGTINDLSIVNLIASMHYLFVPITIDTGDMKSSLCFASKVMEEMITTNITSIRDMKLLWNKVPGRVKTTLCELIDEYMEELSLESLHTVLSHSNRFFKDGAIDGKGSIFRSTLLPPNKNLLRGSNLPELVKEIRSIIKV